MTEPLPQTAPYDAAELRGRWDAFRAEHPKVRIRDAAAQLGTTEAQLVATNLGDTATRLVPGNWPDLFTAFMKLGEVLALTRNEFAVHETHGAYESLHVSGQRASVVGPIDLRLDFSAMHTAFALCEPDAKKSADGIKRSVQIFDINGTALHKVFLQDESNVAAFDDIVAKFAVADQSPAQYTEPRPEPAEPLDDAEIDRAALLDAWSKMLDVHEFYGLFRRFRCTRQQALRLAEGEYTERLAPQAYRQMVARAAEIELPVMVFVGSPGVTQIYSGPVKRQVISGDWFNIMDARFTLHLLETGVAEVWVVRKPTRDGFVTSVELYDAAGNDLVLFFGKRKPGTEELADWRQIVSELPLSR